MLIINNTNSTMLSSRQGEVASVVTGLRLIGRAVSRDLRQASSQCNEMSQGIP